MRSGILRNYCAALRLRLDAPFPRQLAVARRRFLRFLVV